MSDVTEFRAQGELILKMTRPTLADLEAFCADARALGLDNDAQLLPFRAGMLGPVVGFHFIVPVVPKAPMG